MQGPRGRLSTHLLPCQPRSAVPVRQRERQPPGKHGACLHLLPPVPLLNMYTQPFTVLSGLLQEYMSLLESWVEQIPKLDVDLSRLTG